jgi:hypothetical protein
MVHSRADAAVRAGNDIFFSHQPGKIHEAIRNRLRMFYEVAIVSRNSGNQYLAVRKFDLLPDAPLMLVARIGRLDGISARADRQNEIDDIS